MIWRRSEGGGHFDCVNAGTSLYDSTSAAEPLVFGIGLTLMRTSLKHHQSTMARPGICPVESASSVNLYYESGVIDKRLGLAEGRRRGQVLLVAAL